MPAKTEKQKRFFGAVMGAKHGQKGVTGAAKKAAKEMTKKDVKKMLSKESFVGLFGEAMGEMGSTHSISLTDHERDVLFQFINDTIDVYNYENDEDQKVIEDILNKLANSSEQSASGEDISGESLPPSEE